MSAARLLVATSNPGKMRELVALCADLPFTLVSLADLDTPIAPPEETGDTCRDNAMLKASAYATESGLPCLAEDSGFEVAALEGEPGVRSARVPGRDDAERNAWVYAQLDALGSRVSSARFVSVMALARADGTILHVSEGEVSGEVAPEPRGTNGFGYDPVLYYPPLGRTFAEMTQDEKSSVSHRGRAARLMHDWIRDNAGRVGPPGPTAGKGGPPGPTDA